MKKQTDRNSLIQLYRDIKRRCYDPRSIIYNNYGAKGITMCDEWYSNRESFIEWCMANGYRQGFSVSRIDTGVGYNPSNCVISDVSKKRSDSIHGRAGRRKKDNIALYGVTAKTKHPLWKKYVSMHSRCEDERHNKYKDYGGRGIKVCAEWSGKKGFENFYKWAIKSGWKDDGLTIDRMDNDKGYSPQNCRWATQSEQIKNRRNARYYWYKGEYTYLPDICKAENIPYGKMYLRIVKKNMSVEDAIQDVFGHK